MELLTQMIIVLFVVLLIFIISQGLLFLFFYLLIRKNISIPEDVKMSNWEVVRKRGILPYTSIWVMIYGFSFSVITGSLHEFLVERSTISMIEIILYLIIGLIIGLFSWQYAEEKYKAWNAKKVKVNDQVRSAPLFRKTSNIERKNGNENNVKN